MMRGFWGVAICATLLLVVPACGGDETDVDATVATATRVRGTIKVGEAEVRSQRRAIVDEMVTSGESGLASIDLDGGSQLLLGENGQLKILDSESVLLSAGRVFVEADGVPTAVQTAHGTLRISDAAVSVRSSDGATVAYVVRGELSYVTESARGVVRAGDRLTLGSSEPVIAAEVLWDDWTGGLAQSAGADVEGVTGMGALVARVPDEIGQARWPLVIRRMNVSIRVIGDLALTEVEQTFFNPASETVEGLYRIRMPESAVLQRFAVDRNGQLVDGYVREKAQAQQAYEAQVYQGSTLDPALLEWDSPGSYRARIYPIQAGATRRIVVRYAEWLTQRPGDDFRSYRYPIGGNADMPQIQEFSLTADLSAAGMDRVRAGLEAEIVDDRVVIRRSDFRPRADFWMELFGDAPDSQGAFMAPHEPPERDPTSRAIPNEADERDYWYLPLVLPSETFGERDLTDQGLDLVIVADVSAATDDGNLELGRTVIESLVSHLGAEDRVAIVTSDLGIRSLEGESAPALQAASADHLEPLLDQLARVRPGGATDLGASLTEAAELLDPTRNGAIVYVGDGAPTVGELGAEDLLEKLGRLPHPARLYAIGVGQGANLGLLDSLSRGGGLAMRVEERRQAARAANRLLSHASRPVISRVVVDLGTGIDNVFPRRPSDVVLGDVLPVVGRVQDGTPAEVKVSGVLLGEEFEVMVPITTTPVDNSEDLRLRWAGERLRQLLLEGATREEVAELGTRYGLITPFTSYYVPSAQELQNMPGASRLLETPLLQYAAVERRGMMPSMGSPLLAALVLAGCQEGDAAQSEATPDFLSALPESNAQEMQMEEEGAMGGEASGETNSRYAVEGPTDSADPGMTREEARNAAVQAPPPATPTPEAVEMAPEPQGATATTANEQLDRLGFIGTEDGESAGFGGLGIRGSGRGGGGTGEGTIGLGNLGTIGHGGGGGQGNGYGSGAASAERDQAEGGFRTPVQAARPTRRARLDGNQPSRSGLGEQRANREPSADDAPEETARIAQDARQQAETALLGALSEFELGDVLAGADADERGVLAQLAANGYRGPDSGRFGRGRRVVIDTASHRLSRCSDTSRQTISARSSLWSERLSRYNTVSEWLEVRRDAIRNCEVRSARDRRTLLTAMLRRAGNIEQMISLYENFSSPSERAFLRASILRRVRTPDALRLVRNAFGLSASADWELVEEMINRATSPRARLRVLRDFIEQFPTSFELKLKLLEELERTGDVAEAKRMASRMRVDPTADAGVRTAIGEMYLRVGEEDEARRVFSEIVEFAPTDASARRRLGDLYRAHGWFEQAYRQYLTLSTIRPDDLSVLLLLAQAAAGAGRIDEALRFEQRVAETAQPGSSQGIAQTAIFWSSVRFAQLRAEAGGDEEKLRALLARMRRSGVLGQSAGLRVALTWAHPDAQISLYGGHPGLGLSRPRDIAPEFGIEVFDVEEQEDGTYRIEVRRNELDEEGDREHLTEARAELLVLWNEGQADEKIERVPLSFEGDNLVFAWTIEGQSMSASTPRGNR